MTWVISILILAAITYGVFAGHKRGMILIGLEIVSFAIATVIALYGYHGLGEVIKQIFGVNIALGNISAFIILWALTEIACGMLIHRFIFPRLPTNLYRATGLNHIGGALLGGFKTAAILTLALVFFAGLPLDASTKRQVTDGPVQSLMLASSGDLQSRLAVGLGRDINDGFDFFTITAEPESEVLIELGYTTTAVVVDSHAETELLDLLNEDRKKEGLDPLKVNLDARAVARAYSTDMFARGFFSHINPEGETPFDRMSNGGVKYTSAGENLALAPTYAQAHDGLMKSPEHRANILSKSYKAVGIGVVDGGEYGLMVTQNFTD